MDFNLRRFIEAQDSSCRGYAQALSEIKNGRKLSHWIWYIFPQLKGLGHSYNSRFYGISGRAEAAAYLDDERLGKHLQEITKALLTIRGKDAEEILGDIDAKKVQSCMTLFDAVCPDYIFHDVLEKYFNGIPCRLTLDLLKRHS